MTILITGSSGLIGSAAVEYYDARGETVVGVDNNMRRVFFGEPGDTSWNLARLKRVTKHFQHCDLDIRNYDALDALFQEHRFDRIIHCAAQPSHDKAQEIPRVDFEVNATGTLNLLEATRLHCPEAVFCHMSTNKVYGDAPNRYPLVEFEKRYDYAQPERYYGIDETCSVDQCLHTLFGVSKSAGDFVAQEYGRYFGMNVGVFRGGCLTGPAHSGVQLHGFLSYLVKVGVSGRPYTIFGYKGKQVRDNIHSEDVVRAFDAYAANPRPGEVYNLGGGRENSISVLEAIEAVEGLTGTRFDWSYDDTNRIGDHRCYISDLRKFKSHYPEWSITHPLDAILEEMVRWESERKRS